MSGHEGQSSYQAAAAEGATFVLTLQPSPQSVGVARQAVAEWARQLDASAVVEVAVLLVSEVATNVVRHAGTAYTMTAKWLPPIFHVEVADGTPPPQRMARSAGQVGGWGFELLDQLSCAWGIDQRSGGTKAVWFEVEQPPAPSSVEGRSVYQRVRRDR